MNNENLMMKNVGVQRMRDAEGGTSARKGGVSKNRNGVSNF